jgi:hypothetical protein
MNHRSFSLTVTVCVAVAALAACDPKPKEPKASNATPLAPATFVAAQHDKPA